jgi:exonuclease VII small subunit
VQLSRFCHAKLEEAERRLDILNERGELRQAPAAMGLTPSDESGKRR